MGDFLCGLLAGLVLLGKDDAVREDFLDAGIGEDVDLVVGEPFLDVSVLRALYSGPITSAYLESASS